jgi:hypothetical protein
METDKVELLTSDYVFGEVAINLPVLPGDATTHWAQLRSSPEEVPTC